MKYKAWLIVKGFGQCPGQDYLEMYSPIVYIKSICTIIAIATAKHLLMQQMDVKGTYCIGNYLRPESLLVSSIKCTPEILDLLQSQQSKVFQIPTKDNYATSILATIPLELQLQTSPLSWQK